VRCPVRRKNFSGLINARKNMWKEKGGATIINKKRKICEDWKNEEKT
jgi:hypothetical protein